MAWTRGSVSRRKARLPRDWEARRRRRLEEDGYRCTAISATTEQRCRSRATDVDHVIPDSEGGDDSHANLTSLCGWHHRQKTGQEGARGRARKQKKPPHRHPGILP